MGPEVEAGQAVADQAAAVEVVVALRRQEEAVGVPSRHQEELAWYSGSERSPRSP